MNKDGEKSEITYIPFNAEQQMAIITGKSLITRIKVGTKIEYQNEELDWIEGTVLSYNSIQTTLEQEVIELQANTTVRLKDDPSTVGGLIYDNNLLNIEYDAEDLQELLRFQFGNGFSRNYLLGNIEATGGLEIAVRSSLAMIDGILVFFKVPQKLVVKAGLSTIRKDLLVLRKSQADNSVSLVIKQGVPNVNPQVPTLEENVGGVYEIALAEITVQPNVQIINQSDIKDVRRPVINSDYIPLPSWYTQYALSNGTFDANEAPNNWYKKMYGIDTTWELLFNTDSVYFRTEGSLANEGRSSGIQGDATRKINGKVRVEIRTIYNVNGSLFNGASGLNPVVPNGGSIGWSDCVELDNSKQVPIANEFRTRNRLIRVYHLLSINGVNVSDMLGG